jgi:hypothetical protein
LSVGESETVMHCAEMTLIDFRRSKARSASSRHFVLGVSVAAQGLWM